jgi:hypothetical protein
VVADLAALRDLYAWMRSEGVLYARMGEIELRLGPAPSLPVADESPLSPADEERRSLETLLYSSGSDVTPFLTRQPVPQVKT